jgi:hypothetical protein
MRRVSDLLKFAAFFVIAVLLLALALRLVVGFFVGLLVPLLLIIGLIVVAYWLMSKRGQDE